MHDEQAFLENIRANPTDTNAWLVLADWLEERGDPRAEFVRIRQELLTIDVPHRETLEERMQDLLRDGMEPLVVTETNSIGMKLVLIPPGEFLMGSPEDEYWRQDNEYQHPVRITKPYCLGLCQVSQKQYEIVTGTNPSEVKGKDRPVEMVSWDDAMEFCGRLSEDEGKAYTLPSEAQWEYGCRAGTTTPFAFGTALSSKTDANFDGKYGGRKRGPYRMETAPVGNYRPNAWGLYDMHGNVWEWCSDVYDEDYYKQSQVDDPPGPRSGNLRITRGGCWINPPEYARSAYRVPCNSFDCGSFGYLGFRISRTL